MRFILALFLAFFCSQAAAAPTVSSATLPDRGFWWVENQDGDFVFLDIGPDGFAFAVLGGFVDGTASYVVMQGPIQRATAASAAGDSGVIGTLQSPIYEAVGGACFSCPWTRPTIRNSPLGSGTLTFVAGDTARLEAFGRILQIRRFPLYQISSSAKPDRYVGKWVVVLRGPAGVQTDAVEISLHEPSPGRMVPTILFPNPDGPARRSLRPCGGVDLELEPSGALRMLGRNMMGCSPSGYRFHERDGALYGIQLFASSAGESAASELILYRVPRDW
jgi:hypothetical protein